MVVETERLRLRELDAERDAACMLELLNEPAYHANIGDRGVRTLEQATRYLTDRVVASYARHGFGLYAIERREDAAWLGIAGLLRRDTLPMPDIGYALLARHTGQGYAYEAVRAAVAHARDTLHLPQVCAIVVPGNAASIRLLEKLGLHRQDMRVLPPGDELLAYYTIRFNAAAVDS
ncbi:GNAT family N-acetyltransferase [Melittangium boletus]|uniref:GNAT family N-acetyltransferase n=1 Tax=Melittangium boletus TaxID=83453 RepID=UPI001FEAF6E0|nr:GNAT family N-acetyltransferase [Melittangium boletus]